jgi:transposase
MSTKRKSRTYTREFKLEVLQLLETSGKTATQLEKELGIGSTNIGRWKRKFAKEGMQAFPGKGHLTGPEEEVRRLRREMEILRQERDILKKAVAIFSQEKD